MRYMQGVKPALANDVEPVRERHRKRYLRRDEPTELGHWSHMPVRDQGAKACQERHVHEIETVGECARGNERPPLQRAEHSSGDGFVIVRQRTVRTACEK